MMKLENEKQKIDEFFSKHTDAEIKAKFDKYSWQNKPKKQFFIYGVVARLRYAVGSLVLAMVFIVLVVPFNLAYILTNKDYALQYIKWADNVFKRP